jgi:hypothetical protein
MHSLCFADASPLPLGEVILQGLSTMGQLLWSLALLGRLTALTFEEACEPFCMLLPAADAPPRALKQQESEVSQQGVDDDIFCSRLLLHVATAWLSLEVQGQTCDMVCRPVPVSVPHSVACAYIS